jgi:hypothetical protein
MPNGLPPSSGFLIPIQCGEITASLINGERAVENLRSCRFFHRARRRRELDFALAGLELRSTLRSTRINDVLDSRDIGRLFGGHYANMSICADLVMSSSMRAVPARDLSTDQIAAWTEILNESELLSSPYLRPEFTQAVAAVRNDIEVAVAERNDEPVAFLPFRRMPWGGGRPAGGWLANFQAIIARPDFELDPVELLQSCGLRNWQFDQLLVPPKSIEPYVWRSWESPYADLSDGFDEYCRRLRVGRNRLTELQRQQRKMARDLGDVRFEHHVSNRKSCVRSSSGRPHITRAPASEISSPRTGFASYWTCCSTTRAKISPHCCQSCMPATASRRSLTHCGRGRTCKAGSPLSTASCMPTRPACNC